MEVDGGGDGDGDGNGDAFLALSLFRSSSGSQTMASKTFKKSRGTAVPLAHLLLQH